MAPLKGYLMSRDKFKLQPEFPAVITGASSGIGKALSIYLAKEYKARLVISGRNQEQLEETEKLIKEAGGQCVTVAADIGVRGCAKNLVETCVKEYGSIHLLVNNAGMAYPGLSTKLVEDNWRRVFDVNFFACLEAVYAAIPHFKELGGGKVVNISSVAGKVTFAGSVCYASSKHALNAMSVGLGSELARENIDFLTVCPGWVRTEFFEKNKVVPDKNPTLIAGQNNISGWLMRNVMSITSLDVAIEIDKYLRKGGSHEIIMTTPGKLVERIQALFPGIIWSINCMLPRASLDHSVNSDITSEKDKVKS